MPPSLLGASALALGLLSASAAAAAEPTATEISVARQLFAAGREAEDQGRWGEAAASFRRAAGIKDTPGIRFHLARCEEEQNRFVEALVEYDRARELLEAGVKAPDVEKLLPDARERVRAKIALLTLKVEDGVRNVSVQMDGKALAPSVLGVPLPVNPGSHRLRAVAVGRRPFAGEVQLGLGEVREVEVSLPVETTVPKVDTPAAPLSKSVSSDAPTAGVPARTLVLIGEASLLAASLGTGIYFAVAKSQAQERYDTANRDVLAQVGGDDPSGTACSVPREGCVALQQARDDRSRAGTLATAGFVMAGASAAALGLTFWLWPKARPAVAAQVGPHGGKISVFAAF